MIIITGTVDVDPERREAALIAAQPHMRATRALEGCLDYVWSADPLVPGRIYVYERWESREHPICSRVMAAKPLSETPSSSRVMTA